MSTLIEEIAIVDQLLDQHSLQLGKDFTAYRNHVYRVVNLCLNFIEDDKHLDRVAIAATFHDIGIWTDNTFDYLRPSCQVAHDYLNSSGRTGWSHEISEMILQHHKITRYRGSHELMVESLRRADWIDVTKGLLTFGLSRSKIKEILSTWPSAGFHRKLIQLELVRLRTDPSNPVPMLKW